jgi:hypothetical protein
MIEKIRMELSFQGINDAGSIKERLRIMKEYFGLNNS